MAVACCGSWQLVLGWLRLRCLPCVPALLPPPQVDRSRRHLDAGVASRFWSLVDQDIFVRKPYLLPKGVSNVPAAPQAGAAATGAAATA